MADTTGVSTPDTEDGADFAGYADDEFGPDAPSEYTTETAQDAPARAAARRPVVTGNAGATGRRKEAIARVRITRTRPSSRSRTRSGRFPSKCRKEA